MAAGDPYHVVLRIRYKGLKMLKIRDCPTHNSVRGREQMSELRDMIRKDMDSTALRLGSSLPKKDKVFLSGDFGDAVEAHYETQKGNVSSFTLLFCADSSIWARNAGLVKKCADDQRWMCG